MSKNKLSSRNNHAASLNKGKFSSRNITSPNTSYLSRLFFILSFLPKIVHSLPIFNHGSHHISVQLEHNDVAESEAMSSQEFYINLFTSIFLVLAGGVFAGLTLGLMGQDEVYLKVIATSGEPHERHYARRVLRLIGRGKHWVLVTLLLCNVITNETLPVVLDHCLGGGWPAVVTSTASIVIFGEIIPQSICVRYGLQVGAIFSPFVLVLMYIMYPVAYPCALLLDHILGEDHGTVYKKSGLKTLVTLHKTMGVERLNQDEVTIISAVLDLKEKPVSHIMTPMDRVYTMSADTILDEKTVEEIFNAGFSRIPIYLPNEPMNFIGMLLVRVLISYDPEDALPVASFPLATLPETGAETSCLNILNYFQEGKSHMIVVSEHPGEPTGAMGVLTLEDVIEELIGEEIVDESDVYVDINKNIKRKQPGPLSKRNLTSYLHNLYQRSATNSKRNSLDNGSFNVKDTQPAPIKPNTPQPIVDDQTYSKSPPNGKLKLANAPVSSPLLGAVESSKNWKPKNPAANPLETNKPFVTIKRPNIDTVRNVVIGEQNKDKSKTYGAVHSTEEGALKDAENQRKLSQEHARDHRFLLPDERETDVSEINGERSNGSSPHHEGEGQRIPHSNSLPVPEYQESRSYRTGGIIESVVNVQGVHKTIIEHISDDEDDVSRGSVSLNGGSSKAFELGDDDKSDDEGQRLLAGLKSRRSSGTVNSDESKSRFSVWK